MKAQTSSTSLKRGNKLAGSYNVNIAIDWEMISIFMTASIFLLIDSLLISSMFVYLYTHASVPPLIREITTVTTAGIIITTFVIVIWTFLINSQRYMTDDGWRTDIVTIETGRNYYLKMFSRLFYWFMAIMMASILWFICLGPIVFFYNR